MLYKSEVKVVPVQAMEAYKRSGGIVPLILNLSTRWRWLVNVMPLSLYHRERTPYGVELEVMFSTVIGRLSPPPAAPEPWRATVVTCGAVSTNEFSRVTSTNSQHLSGLPFVLKVFISAYWIITLTLHYLLLKVNTVQLYRTLSLLRTVIRWKRQGVIKHSVKCVTLPPSIKRESIQNLCFMFFFSNFLCSNTRRPSSSSNSI
jgi:hypothetical protein